MKRIVIGVIEGVILCCIAAAVGVVVTLLMQKPKDQPFVFGILKGGLGNGMVRLTNDDQSILTVDWSVRPDPLIIYGDSYTNHNLSH